MNEIELFQVAEKEYLKQDTSIIKLAAKYNFSRYKFTKYLKKQGVVVINRQNEIKWSIEEVVRLNNEGISLVQLGKKFGVTAGAISVALKRRNFHVINQQNLLKFDNTVFDSIDSEEKAYWLGFIYADGWVSATDNTFELSLGLKDTKHLQKFADFMNHSNNVRITDNYRCRFCVTDKHLKKRLIELGCIPRKSLILEFPSEDQVPKQLLSHFIRGYFDGDGCIITKETSCVKLVTSLLGTENVLEGIKRNANIIANIRHDARRHLSCKHFALSAGKSEIFLDYLYKDANVYLERKHNLYKNYLNITYGKNNTE